MTEGPIGIILECTRTSDPEDPFAFRFEPQDYTLRSPGGAVTRFWIVWSKALLRALEELRRHGRDPALVQCLGEMLRRALSASSWRDSERAIVDAERAGRRVHVTLRSNAAELFALPWELLTVGAGGQHLGELAHVVLRHEWPKTESEPLPATTEAKPSPRPAGGRILFAWSAAGGEVPASEHLEAIASACRSSFADFDRARDVLAHASARSLAEALARAADAGEPYAVLHLLGHGGAAGSSFGLTLDDEGGGPQVVDAGRLRHLIAAHAATLRLVVLSACDSGNAGALGNQLGSVAQALHRAGVHSVVASRYPLSVAGSITLTTALYRGLLVDLRSLEQAFSGARSALALDAGSLDWASVQLYARADDSDDTRPVVLRPYRGLQVFESQHQRLFFGRDREADETVAEIEALARSAGPRMFFLSGASGSGKSSLARAAVLPRLRPGFAEVFIARPGDPYDGLPAARPLLLMLDQAEELFTVLDADARASVIERLDALARDDAGSVVLFTLRADFIGRCGEIALPDGRRLDALESNDAHRVYVPVMDRSAMVKIITGPAALAGLRLQEGLAELLVDEVAGEPGALPLLEFTLDRMWSTRDPRDRLTLTGYEALGGGVGGVLEREADALIESLAEPATAEARRLLVQLVATGEGQRADTRRVRRIAELRPAEPAIFDEVLARLTAARLVVTSGESDPQVEIAHEELIRRWGRLRAWVDADRQKWIEIERVRSWDHLLRGAQLDRAREARRLYGTELGETALAHLSVSEQVVAAEEELEQQRKQELQQAKTKAEEEAERARQRAIVARRRAIVATVAAIVAVVVAIMAGNFYMRANEASQQAYNERVKAEGKAVIANERTSRALAESRRARDAIRISAAKGFLTRDPVISALFLSQIESTSAEDLVGFLDTAMTASEDASPSTVVLAHDKAVLSAVFSADGGRVLTASDDGTGRVWNAVTGEPVGPPLKHDKAVLSAVFSGDGGRVLTASNDGTARVWNAMTGEPVGPTLEHGGSVYSAVFSADGGWVVTASDDWTARVWSASTGEPAGLPLKHGGPVNSAVFSADGGRVLTASDDWTARVWSAATGEPAGPTLKHDDSVMSAVFSADGGWVLTASRDSTARMWNAATGEPVGPTLKHDYAVRSAVFSADGGRVLTASNDRTARVWNAVTGESVGPTLKHDKSVNSAVFSGDGGRVLTASSDGTARVWSVVTGEPVAPLWHDSSVNSAVFSGDGSGVLTASHRTAQVWNALTGEPVGPPLKHDGMVMSAVFSADGGRVLTASQDGTARVWNAVTGEPVGPPLKYDGKYGSAVFSADGGRVLTASHYTAQVLNALTGEPLGPSFKHDGPVRSAVFLGDGGRVLTSSRRTAQVWNAVTREPVGPPLKHDGPVRSAVFSGGGGRVLTSDDGTAQVWSAVTGEPVGPPIKHDGPVRSAVFSGDEGRVLIVSDSGTARVWNAVTGEPVALKYDGWVERAVFSGDGGRLLTASSSDGTARVWNAVTGEPVGLPLMHDTAVLSADFSGDGGRVLTASGQTARVWNAETGASLMEPMWLRYLRTRVRGCLPRRYRQEYLGETAEQAGERLAACQARLGGDLNGKAVPH